MRSSGRVHFSGRRRRRWGHFSAGRSGPCTLFGPRTPPPGPKLADLCARQARLRTDLWTWRHGQGPVYTFRSADSSTGAKVGRFVRTAGTFADQKVRTVTLYARESGPGKDVCGHKSVPDATKRPILSATPGLPTKPDEPRDKKRGARDNLRRPASLNRAKA